MTKDRMFTRSRTLKTFVGDVFSALIFLALFALLLIPASRRFYESLNVSHPYVMGFLKVAVLATFGEILSKRLALGWYELPVGIHLRALVWGILGITFVAIFELYFSGTKALLDSRLLPFNTGARPFFQAFYTSTLMNLTFAPVFMAIHRITDAYIDLSNGKLSLIHKLKFEDVVRQVDWLGFVRFVLLKTIPFFWIPAHTVTFLLPSNFRILSAALLSVMLGGLLSLRRRHSH